MGGRGASSNKQAKLHQEILKLGKEIQKYRLFGSEEDRKKRAELVAQQHLKQAELTLLGIKKGSEHWKKQKAKIAEMKK